jgi:serine/threonine protein kinase
MDPQKLIGQTLGHYRVLRQIGYGGMATVYLAEDINLGREVAVKIFWPRPGETQDFLRRFAREARVLAQLDHPNILPVYDYGEQDGFAYLVTPYLPGGTLKDLLKVRKALPPSEVLRLAAPMLNGLQYAHERGLIHRDIKPANMLFKADGSLVLADFGLVKVTSSTGDSGAQFDMTNQTRTAVTGTPEYMSPEQIAGKATQASDIYAVGIVLYEMLAGKRPFTSDSMVGVLMQQTHEQPRPMRESNPFISPQLDAVVLRALEKDPARRYARPNDFLQALLSAGSPGMATSPDLTGSSLYPTTPTAWAGSSRQDAASVPPQVAPRSGASGAEHRVFEKTSEAGYAPPLPQQSQSPQPQSAPITPLVYPDAHFQTELAPMSPMTPTRQDAPPFRIDTNPPASLPRRGAPVLLGVISLLIIAGLLLAVFLTPLGHTLFGLGPGTTPTTGPGTPGPGVTQTTTVPPTACPAAGTARTASMPSITQGSDPNIVYFVNSGTSAAPVATLSRYDTVTAQSSKIISMTNARITNAQISDDGQWILFTTTIAGQQQLRLLRMDGQQLQTLYCAPGGATIVSPQWSLSQQLIVFGQAPGNGAYTLDLLKVASGTLLTELSIPGGNLDYLPRTWLDYTKVLLTGYTLTSNAPEQNVYILDTTRGPNQQVSSLQQIATAGTQSPCWDFDSSFDSTKVFVSQCSSNPTNASTTISTIAASGNAQPTTAFSSSSLNFINVRVYDKANDLLATTINSLYSIPTDDSNNATQLVTVNQGGVLLNGYSQYYWSNVSRDGSLYALENAYSQQGQNTTFSLMYGQLSGGTPHTFASVNDGSDLAIAGWDTM